MAKNKRYDPSFNVRHNIKASVKRLDDLRASEVNHIEKMATLRTQYELQIRGITIELRHAESARIDAIRAVDVAAVQRAAEVAAEAVQTLAAQVPITAEAVRTSLAAALNPILNDIGELRKVQYEQAGLKAGTTEQRESFSGSRSAWFTVAGLLLATAVLISPHIHP